MATTGTQYLIAVTHGNRTVSHWFRGDGSLAHPGWHYTVTLDGVVWGSGWAPDQETARQMAWAVATSEI